MRRERPGGLGDRTRSQYGPQKMPPSGQTTVGRAGRVRYTLESTEEIFGAHPRPTRNVRCLACPHDYHPEPITAFLFIPKKPHPCWPLPHTTHPSLSSWGQLRQCAGGRVLKGNLGSNPIGSATNLLCGFQVKVQSVGSRPDSWVLSASSPLTSFVSFGLLYILSVSLLLYLQQG